MSQLFTTLTHLRGILDESSLIVRSRANSLDADNPAHALKKAHMSRADKLVPKLRAEAPTKLTHHHDDDDSDNESSSSNASSAVGGGVGVIAAVTVWGD